MTLHNYRSRQVHETLNGVNPSSSFRDMPSAKSGPNLWQIWQVFGPWASPYGANGHMTMTVHTYRPRQFHRTLNEKIRQVVTEIWVPQVWQPPAHPPGPWRQYPSSPEGWGVKRVQVIACFQVITWTNADILSTGPLERKLRWNFNQNTMIISQENALDNVICKISSISLMPQCVNP